MYGLIGRVLEKFEAMAMAVAFAEAGEWDTARQLADRDYKNQKPKIEKRERPKPGKQPRMRV